MEVPSKDLIALINHLAPGFLAAWVFYRLTSYSKPSAFERIVQALVFTLIIEVGTSIVRILMMGFGSLLFSVGVWTNDSDLAWSLVLALFLGLIFSYVANNDVLHAFLRKKNFTKRTSFPSEWCAAFEMHGYAENLNEEERWIVLHLSDGRRLFGWPREWPHQADEGHFIIQKPEWLLPSGERAPVQIDEALLIAAADVKMVEFLKPDKDIVGESEAVGKSLKLLVNLQEDEKHGK